MPIYARPDAIAGLADIDWHFVQVTQNVASNIIGKCSERSFPEPKVDGHFAKLRLRDVGCPSSSRIAVPKAHA